MECTREDSEAVVAMIKAVLNRLNLGREDVSEMVKRSDRHEVHLMYLRFFNILMSRKKGKGEETKVSLSYTCMDLSSCDVYSNAIERDGVCPCGELRVLFLFQC